MWKRIEQARIEQLLGEFPAVALLGPRQVGKTTLALELAEGRDTVYLDLESEIDRNKLANAETYLGEQRGRLVILDEAQRMPGLFEALRGVIDRNRRSGIRPGQFLILGSASLELLRQSSESLAGRIAYSHLHGLSPLEVGAAATSTLWLRGGFPDSFQASSDAASMRWRRDFLRTYLERDIPQLGPRIPAETLRRFWTMLAHQQGELLNAAQLARSLGVDGKTVASYLDLMVDLLLVRRLPPWRANVGKRLVKSPKVFVRDSGIVHALLGLQGRDALLGHPVVGASWEGFVLETIFAHLPEGWEAYFYRTAAGAELDVVLRSPQGGLWAIEIKYSEAPKVGKGFHHACQDLDPERRLVVYPGSERFALKAEAQAISLPDLAMQLAES